MVYPSQQIPLFVLIFTNESSMIFSIPYQSRFCYSLEQPETSYFSSINEITKIENKKLQKSKKPHNFAIPKNNNKQQKKNKINQQQKKLSRYKMNRSRADSEDKQINWHDYNYPPLLNMMHFRPSQIPQDRKTLIIMLFAIHIIILLNTILNIIDNCIQGGLGILYAFLFFFIFNPIVLFLFYRAHVGLCREKAKLGLYIYIQPLVIIIEIVISIVDFLGFNGFIRVANLFDNNQAVEGIFGLVVSIIYLLVAFLSSYIYFRIFKSRSILTQALL